jgi:hypothetical protein
MVVRLQSFFHRHHPACPGDPISGVENRIARMKRAMTKQESYDHELDY